VILETKKNAQYAIEELQKEMEQIRKDANASQRQIKTQLPITQQELLSKQEQLVETKKASQYAIEELQKEMEQVRQDALKTQKEYEANANKLVFESTAQADSLQTQVDLLHDDLELMRRVLESQKKLSYRKTKKFENELERRRHESDRLIDSIEAAAIKHLNEADSNLAEFLSEISEILKALQVLQRQDWIIDQISDTVPGRSTLSEFERKSLSSAFEKLDRMHGSLLKIIEEIDSKSRVTIAIKMTKEAHANTGEKNKTIAMIAENLRMSFEEMNPKTSNDQVIDEKEQYRRQHAANHYLADLHECLFKNVDPRNLDFCKEMLSEAVAVIKSAGVNLTDYQVASAISEIECEHENEKRSELIREEKGMKERRK
jgi:hypothetical protein